MKYDRYIFHVDVNSAFLSWTAVERLKQNPDSVDLRTIPSAIGGDVEKRRGVVVAKSIPAKNMGIKSGEAIASALKKCPKLLVAHSEFSVYRKYSKEFIKILHKYSPTVQQFSIDEAFVDVTALENIYRELESEDLKFPLSLANKIKNEIYEELGFTVNIGISSNKFLAKTASDFSKPDKIHTLYPHEVEEKLWKLPLGEMFGCGRATAQKLHKVGLKTIGDLANADERMLISLLGEKAGTAMYRNANGMGSSHVNIEKHDAKSYSNESTTPFDIDADNYVDDMPRLIRELSESVAYRLRKDNMFAKTVGLTVKTNDFERRSMQCQLESHTNSTELIYSTAVKLADRLLLGKEGIFSKGRKVRLVGVSATQLDDGEYKQMNISDIIMQDDLSYDIGVERTQGNTSITDEVMDKIKYKFGKDAILRADQLKNKKLNKV